MRVHLGSGHAGLGLKDRLDAFGVVVGGSGDGEQMAAKPPQSALGSQD